MPETESSTLFTTAAHSSCVIQDCGRCIGDPIELMLSARVAWIVVRVLVIMESVAIKELNYPSPLSSLSLSNCLCFNVSISVFSSVSYSIHVALSKSVCFHSLSYTHYKQKQNLCMHVHECVCVHECMCVCVCVKIHLLKIIFTNKTSSTRKTKI